MHLLQMQSLRATGMSWSIAARYTSRLGKMQQQAVVASALKNYIGAYIVYIGAPGLLCPGLNTLNHNLLDSGLRYRYILVTRFSRSFHSASVNDYCAISVPTSALLEFTWRYMVMH